MGCLDGKEAQLLNRFSGMLLDTNALISAAVTPSRFGKRARYLVEKSPRLYYSPVSLAELEIKAVNKKLSNLDEFYSGLTDSTLLELPFKANHALALSRFTQLVKHDPFDRLILSQAAAENIGLITSDRIILNLGLPWVIDASE